MVKNSLVYFLEDYLRREVYSFHMPGHKNNKDFLHKDLLEMDITEIPLADNLHDAQGVLLNLQKRIARLFGSDESFLLVNGSSSAVIAAVCAACSDNDRILVSRNSHKSLFNGLVFSGAKPVYVMPEMTKYGFAGSVDPAVIKTALSEDPFVKAIFVTSPTYEGVVSDIEAIARITHEAGKILIVDEAHGSHFNFSDSFPRSAVKCGADIVVNSLHKTLPFLTQTSVLHICGGLADRDKIKKYVSMVQTSSPSYILMGQADYCVSLLEANGADIFESYVKMLGGFRQQARFLKNLLLIEKDLIGGAFDVDIGKLVFYINSNRVSGVEIEGLLSKKFRVQIEAGFEKHIIAMTSCADTQAGYSMLYEGLKEIDGKILFGKHEKETVRGLSDSMPVIAMSPRNAINAASKRLRLEDSENEISAEFIISYPPGIPSVVPGEKITKDIIRKNRNIKHINVVDGGNYNG